MESSGLARLRVAVNLYFIAKSSRHWHLLLLPLLVLLLMLMFALDEFCSRRERNIDGGREGVKG